MGSDDSLASAVYHLAFQYGLWGLCRQSPGQAQGADEQRSYSFSHGVMRLIGKCPLDEQDLIIVEIFSGTGCSGAARLVKVEHFAQASGHESADLFLVSVGSPKLMRANSLPWLMPQEQGKFEAISSKASSCAVSCPVVGFGATSV